MIRFDDIFEDSAWEAQDFDFTRGVQFGFVGITLFYIFFHIIARSVSISEMSPLWQLFIGQIPFVVCGTGAALLGLRKSLQEQDWRKVLDLPAALPSTNRLFCRKLLKWMLLLILGSTLLNWLLASLLKTLGFHNFPMQLLEVFGANAGWSFWIAAFLMAVLVAPLSEEILFRRILYQGLKTLHFSHAGWITALVFSLCHALPQALLSYIFFSLILQKASHKGSLWMAIALHAGYNLIVFALMIGKIFFFSA